MERQPNDRSQPLLRVSRDRTPAEIHLVDGHRTDAFVFVPPTRCVADLLESADAFVPIAVGSGTQLLARDALACITVNAVYARAGDGLPQERQPALVRLRGGTTLRGELRWTAPPERRRVLDHLNDTTEQYLAVHDGDHVHYIAKRAVVSVEET